MAETRESLEHQVKFLECRVKDLEEELKAQREELKQLNRQLESKYSKLDTRLFKAEFRIPNLMMLLTAFGVGSVTAVMLLKLLNQAFRQLLGM